MSTAAIIELVRATPTLQGLDAAALATAINAKTIESRHDARLVPTDFVGRLGVQDAAAASLAFKSAVVPASALPDAVKALIELTVPAGINLAEDSTRGILDTLVLAGFMDSGLASRMKALGRTLSSLADKIGGDVTQEQCQTALTEIAAEDNRTSLLQAATSRWNAVLGAIGDGTATTLEQVISVFGA